MDLVEVNEVGAKARQRRVDVLHDRLARQPGAARAVVHREVDLGGQDDVLAAAVLADCAADDLLRRSRRVDVRGIPKRDAKFHGLTEERLRGVLVHRPCGKRLVGGAIAHRAEREPADLESCRAKSGVLHGESSLDGRALCQEGICSRLTAPNPSLCAKFPLGRGRAIRCDLQRVRFATFCAIAKISLPSSK